MPCFQALLSATKPAKARTLLILPQAQQLHNRGRSVCTRQQQPTPCVLLAQVPLNEAEHTIVLYGPAAKAGGAGAVQGPVLEAAWQSASTGCHAHMGGRGCCSALNDT